MSDAPAETATTDAPATEQIDAGQATETVDQSSEVEKWKSQARKNEERAKANATAAKELAELKASLMSGQEKAVAEAKAAGRAEALAEASVELVDAALATKAAGRLSADQLATLTANLDRAKFLDTEGRVDANAVGQFIDGIAPAPTEEHPPTPSHPLVDLGQGPRGAPPALNSDELTKTLERAVGLRR